jgi:hypothetical protein
MEGTRKRGRTRKRWTDDVKVDLNIMATKNTQELIRDLQERRNFFRSHVPQPSVAFEKNKKRDEVNFVRTRFVQP